MLPPAWTAMAVGLMTTPRVSSSVTVTARSEDTPWYSPPAAVWVRVTLSSLPSPS